MGAYVHSTKKLLCGLTLGLALALSIIAPSAFALEPSADLQRRLDEARKEIGAPGAVVLVGLPDGSVHGAASGVSNLESGTAVTLEERFRIGSITKTFVSVLALKLMSEGAFELDDRLVDYVPEVSALLPRVPQVGEITVRDLLQHSSGLKDYVDILLTLPPPVQERAAASAWTPAEIVAIVYREEPLFAPGEGCDYSSTNFILLGMLIERATCQEIGALLRQHVIEPLSLEDTYFAATEAVTGSQARGYVQDFSGLVDVTEMDRPDIAWATGSILADADDLLEYAQALFEGDLLTADERALMMDWRAMYEKEDYGLGLSRYQTDYGVAYGHGGATMAYRAQMFYLPAQDIYVIALDNLGQSELKVLVSLAAEWALQQVAAVPAQIPATASAAP